MWCQPPARNSYRVLTNIVNKDSAIKTATNLLHNYNDVTLYIYAKLLDTDIALMRYFSQLHCGWPSIREKLTFSGIWSRADREGCFHTHPPSAGYRTWSQTTSLWNIRSSIVSMESNSGNNPVDTHSIYNNEPLLHTIS